MVFATSCDNDFEDLNVDPTASTDLDVNPKFAYLFLKSAGDEFEHSYHKYTLCRTTNSTSNRYGFSTIEYIYDS